MEHNLENKLTLESPAPDAEDDLSSTCISSKLHTEFQKVHITRGFYQNGLKYSEKSVVFPLSLSGIKMSLTFSVL